MRIYIEIKVSLIILHNFLKLCVIHHHSSHEHYSKCFPHIRIIRKQFLSVKYHKGKASPFCSRLNHTVEYGMTKACGITWALLLSCTFSVSCSLSVSSLFQIESRIFQLLFQCTSLSKDPLIKLIRSDQIGI